MTLTRVPDVTVVIPTHDRLGFLQEALASARAQDHPIAQVIVVDDGSSDGTAEWLLETGVRFLRHPQALGGSAARNAGLAECDTTFVLFLDDDDVLRPGAVRHLAAALHAHPAATGSAGAFRRFGALTEAPRDLHPRIQLTIPVWREELFGWNMPPAAVLWRTDMVRAIGGWDSSLPRCEDRDLNLRAYPRPFVLVPTTVMDYRVHAGQPPGSAQLEIDRTVLARFVASLPPNDRRVGQAVIEARRHLDQGLYAYAAGDFRAALPHLVAMLRRAPILVASPVLGPWLIGLAVKAAAGAATPPRAAAALQSARRRRRRLPEQDTVM